MIPFIIVPLGGAGSRPSALSNFRESINAKTLARAESSSRAS